MATETPPELAEWIEARVELLKRTVHRIEAIAEPREGEPVAQWLIPLLTEMSHAETIAKRSVHLLSAYALRTGATSQTDVARATDVTVSAAASRSTSRLARETWQEVWPESR